MNISNVFAGVLCGTAFIAALFIYLFGFANQSISVESLFWAMPLICPIAFVLYLKSRPFGAALQIILYMLAILGSYNMIQNDCLRGNCSTGNPVAILMAGMIAGVHLIAMLLALILMCTGAIVLMRSTSISKAR